VGTLAAVLATASAAAADVGGLPEGTAGAREVVLVANAEAGTVSLVDPRRLEVLRTIDILPDGTEPGIFDNPTQALFGKQVVEAVENDQRELFYPPVVRLLRVVNGVSPRLGDLMLRRILGRSVAPR